MTEQQPPSENPIINPTLLVPHKKGDRLSDNIADTVKKQISKIKIKKSKKQRKKEKAEKNLLLRITPNEYASIISKPKFVLDCCSERSQLPSYKYFDDRNLIGFYTKVKSRRKIIKMLLKVSISSGR